MHTEKQFLNKNETTAVTRASSTSSTSVFPCQVISFNNYSDPPLPVEFGQVADKRIEREKVEM